MMVVTPSRPLQRLDLVAQPQPHARVERRQRLVEQQQAGRGRERAGQRHALLLAARKLGGIFRAGSGRPTSASSSSTRLHDRGALQAPADQAVADIVGDRQVGEQRIGLEDDAEVALGRRQRRDVPPLLVDGAGGLRIEAGDGAQQGGLAAARRTEEADELALGDIETDIAQRGEVAVALGEVADFEKGHRHLLPVYGRWPVGRRGRPQGLEFQIRNFEITVRLAPSLPSPV